MSHTFSKLLCDCVYSTKDRRGLIHEGIQHRLYAYMAGIARRCGAHLVTAGGMPEHVHLLIDIPPTMSVAEAMRLVKTNSSKWLRETFHDQATFAWQTGYAAFSVSESKRAARVHYIETQKEHHRKFGFGEELAELLRRHGILGSSSDIGT